MKLPKLLVGVLAITFLNTGFAADSSCPLLSTIRSNVKMERAMQIGEVGNFDWGLVSKAFEFNEEKWAGIFFVHLPGVTDPGTAVYEAQYFFNNSILQQAKVVEQAGGHKVCNYTPAAAQYQFYVETPVDYGFARLANSQLS